MSCCHARSVFIEPLVIIMILVANGAYQRDSAAPIFPDNHVLTLGDCVFLCGMLLPAATVGVITETNAEKAIEELKAYEVRESTLPEGV